MRTESGWPIAHDTESLDTSEKSALPALYPAQELGRARAQLACPGTDSWLWPVHQLWVVWTLVWTVVSKRTLWMAQGAIHVGLCIYIGIARPGQKRTLKTHGTRRNNRLCI